MPIEAMALQYERLLEAQKLLKTLTSGFEAQLSSRLLRGESLPGWGMESKVGALEWTQPVEEVFALGDLMGVDLRKAPEAITPTQAKNKGLDPSLLSDYASRPNKGVALTKVDPSRAMRIFGNLATGETL